MTYLLDTDILSNLMKRVPSSALIARLVRVPPEQQFTSSITLEDMALSGEEPPEDDESARGLPTIDDIAPRAYRAELAG